LLVAGLHPAHQVRKRRDLEHGLPSAAAGRNIRPIVPPGSLVVYVGDPGKRFFKNVSGPPADGIMFLEGHARQFTPARRGAVLGDQLFPFRKGLSAMFRNTMTEFRLSGNRNASATTSFRPAVEALEERVVLNGMGMTPSSADALLFQIFQGQGALINTIEHHGKFTKRFIGNALQIERGLYALAKDVLLTADLSNDPLAVQLGQSILTTDDQVQPRLLELDLAVGRAQAAQINQGLINFGAKLIVHQLFDQVSQAVQSGISQFQSLLTSSFSGQ
jgi:hypothetical protein